jgi:hypothetical protein
METLRAMPVLQVRDVAESESFYVSIGFGSHGSWGNPPDFCIVQRGNVTLALDRSRSGKIPANQYWAAYVYISDVDALHDEFAALGLPEVTDVRRRNEYGCEDFDIVDPDGHRIGFGQSLDPVPGPGLCDERGRG